MGMLAGPRKPTAKGGLRDRENTGGGARTEPFGYRMKRLGHAVGGRLEPIEWGVPASGALRWQAWQKKPRSVNRFVPTAARPACVAARPGHPRGLRPRTGCRANDRVVAVADEGMNGCICDLEAGAIWMRTSVALGVDGLFAKRATGVFALGVGDQRCGVGRCLAGWAAKQAVIRGARTERSLCTVLGRWRDGAPVWKVAQQGHFSLCCAILLKNA